MLPPGISSITQVSLSAHFPRVTPHNQSMCLVSLWDIILLINPQETNRPILATFPVNFLASRGEHLSSGQHGHALVDFAKVQAVEVQCLYRFVITQIRTSKISFAKRLHSPYLECPGLPSLLVQFSKACISWGLLRAMCGCVVATQNCIQSLGPYIVLRTVACN